MPAANALMMKVRGAAGSLLLHGLTATGVNGDGHPKVLGVDVVTSAGGAGWSASFISDLTVRGLSGVSLINSDNHLGLGAVLGAELVKQRCRTHYLLD